MKKRFFIVIAAAAFLLNGCGTMGTSGMLGGIDGVSAIGNVLGSVLGINKVSESTIFGTWKYAQPGCAFTSENLLAKAGGEVAAQKVKSELLTTYSTMGINSSNTYLTFGEDNSFSGKVAGKSVSGTYALNTNNGQLTLKTLLFSLNGYVNLNTSGMSLLFESQKLLSIFQTVGSMSGNASLSTISELSKNYDGVRLGFDMTR